MGTERDSFVHEAAQCRIVLSIDGAHTAVTETNALGLRRLMIVGSPRALSTKAGASLRAALHDKNSVIFDKVVEHPLLASAIEGGGLAASHGVDGLVAFGGGSAIDLAKGIALQVGAGDPLIRFSTRGRTPDASEFNRVAPLPVIAMPNTASGAEVTPGIGLRDEEGHKLVLRHPHSPCRVVILDPQANLETPARILLPSGLNAVAHCLEGMYSAVRDPISSAQALAALRHLMNGLRRMMDDDGPDVRRDILIGSFLAGRAIVNARTAIHHAICHVLGANGVSHGAANSIILPHALRYNRGAVDELLGEAAVAMAGPRSEEAPCERIVTAIEMLAEAGSLPRRLRDVGIAAESLAQMAESVLLEPGMRFNPKQPVSRDDIQGLLNSAW